MKKSCYNCRYCRSTTGRRLHLYCVLKKRSFRQRIVCQAHAFVFADGFSIPVKEGGSK